MGVIEISFFLVSLPPLQRWPGAASLGHPEAQLGPHWRYMPHSFIQQILIEHSPLRLRAQTPENNLNLTPSHTTS